MSYKKVKQYLDIIRKSCDLVERELEDMWGERPAALPKPVLPQLTEEPEPVFDRKAYVESLLAVPNWPEAVPPHLISSEASTQDQIERANSVLDMVLDSDVTGSHFLDFGCGEGWISRQILLRKVGSSTGYDINKSDNWKKINGPIFTNNFDDLKRGYYNHIMLYDVLDHAENPEEIMTQVRMLIAKDGRVYVKCHPWTSKHASHLFKHKLNKAYIHLFLTWQEIYETIGKVSPMYTRVEKNPLEAYRWWFHSFKVLSEKIVKEPVHPFFLQDEYKQLIQREQQIDPLGMDEFMDRMTIQFADYVLTHKP